MCPVNIHAAEYPIFKVLCDDYVFKIPRYQRPYAWTSEQAGALLDDLLQALDDSAGSVEQLNPYFLGSIVLIKREDSPIADVVDGQQRLTTLTILFAVLRKLVPSDMADDIKTFLYEKGSPLLGTQDRYRLTLRDRDAQFFRDFIQKDEGVNKLLDYTGDLTSSQQNIRNNAIYLLKRLKEITDAKRIRLATFISRRCYLVVVRTPDFDSAYRIFSVLNDRGMDLTHSDILKAEIIGNISSILQTAYTQKWEDAEDSLGREGFKDLFAHIRMIYRKDKMRKSILEEIRSYILPNERPEKFIDETLIPLAKAMKNILNESYESTRLADEINQYFHYLQRVDNMDWLPPAMYYLAKHASDPDALLQFFRDLERLAMGLMIRRAGINERIERYGQLLGAIELNKDLSDVKSPLQLTPEEVKEIISTLDSNIYEITKIRVPVLLRLDQALSGGSASYDFKTITVEHVLPQNPAAGSQWLTWFPDTDIREKLVHSIGNLVLLSRSKNSQASNFEFERKKTEYFKRKGVSPFALTTEVINEPNWEPAVIEQRQKRLLNILIQVWRLT